MELLQVAVVIVLATALFIGPAILIRMLARIPFYWVFNPANTLCLIVTEEDASGDGMTGGGNLVNVLHAVPGDRLDKSSHDLMKWEFKEDEEDPDHGFLYRTLGVQSMGSIFYTTRFNDDKRLRFSREKSAREEKGEVRSINHEDLHAVTKENRSRNVFVTGEMTVVIKEADTADKLGLDFEIDFIFKRQFPVRSILRLADSAAFLTSQVEQAVNNATSSMPAEAYYGGPEAQKNRTRLGQRIVKNKIFQQQILDEIGLKITSASIRDVKIPASQLLLLQRQIDAETEAKAKVTRAKGERDAQIALNDADADRIERVIKPAAASSLTTSVRWAEAFEKQKAITTLVTGPGALPTIPLGGTKEPKEEKPA